MPHYNLYNAVGSDRSKDAASLAAELDQRIASGVATNPGGIEELKIARSILGDPQRRAMYDQRLDDPTAPDIDVAALRELAALDTTGGAGQAGQAAPTAQPGQPQYGAGQPGQPGQPEQGKFANVSAAKQNFSEKFNPVVTRTRSEFNRSSKSIVAATALLTVLTMLLVWGLIALGSWGFSEERKVRSKANEFLNMRTDAETEQWLVENAAPDYRSDMKDSLEIGDDYSGVDNEFDARDPRAGRVTPGTEFAEILSYYDEDAYRAELEREGMSEMYFVAVDNKDGTATGGILLFGIIDGKPKLLGIDHTDIGDYYLDF
ncbi:hypothetical protein [Corynebacterium sp. CCUG 70398]|uniref:hypothetical protein n=1 Tax=Corynebacterium sp. CCUG 70398 TaxID=2823891 RepID=UPI00210E0924|nr:hypothetical protein [Corynebacterium sp. CCUG 70398]MCQ4623589.1 hypothetical protein [Corynebacterium sp. CCUG 70398]